MFDALFLIILVGSGLVILSVLTSLLAFRLGAPLLLLFLALGLAVGEDGLGIQFDDAFAAYFIGSVALAIILFDSGFGTRFETVTRAAGPALVLATFGVVATTVLIGLAVHYLSGLSLLASFLLGAIVSSTDAAAVFFLLRVGGIKIRERVRATLEVESGSNDPMAVFLTVTLVELIVAGADREAATLEFLQSFGLQMGLGAALGAAGGLLVARVINRLRLEAGLYPVLALGLALFIFALTSVVGGSGFLAVYIAGLIAGNRARQAMPSLRRFQDGVTWLCQIVMFLMLGLLATPSNFPSILPQGLFVALFLIFVARPLAVWLSLLPFRFSREETAFIAWVGLRGAVSILLAIAPMLAGIPVGQAFFNIAFIVVLTSLLLQAWTIRPMARWLGLVVPPVIGPVERIELELPGSVKHELVVYRIVEGSPVATGGRVPRWARPSLIVRDGNSMHIHEAGRLRPGDLVYIFIAPQLIRLLDRLFASPVEIEEGDADFFGEFVLSGSARLGEVAAQYGLEVDPKHADATLGELFSQRYGHDVHRGDRLTLGLVELIAREVNDDDTVRTVGVSLTPTETSRARLPLFQSRDEIATAFRRWLGRLRRRQRPGPAEPPAEAEAHVGSDADGAPPAR